MSSFSKITMPVVAIAAITVALNTAHAQTQQATQAVQAYKAAVELGIDECRIQVNDNIAAVQWRLEQTGKPVECIADHKPRIKAAFDAAAKATKKADAKTAIKDHAAASFAAMDGLLKLTDESTPAYEARQRAREARLADLWARVEIAL